MKTSNYNRVTELILNRLDLIVGEKNIILNKEKMKDYSHDETGEDYMEMPEVVVTVNSVEEISEIMKLANAEKIPVTPRGAGSGVSGGAVPLFGGILISLEKMNKILEIDLENLIAVVEPGVITNELNNILQQEGLFFAGYPMSAETCFIGGNVAENAGGGRALKYGVTGRYVLGLEVVLPTGEIALFGGKRVKDVTGYNMVQLMIGSEGTLGIFSKIYLKLLPLPKAKIDVLVTFDDIDKALSVVPLIMTSLRFIPTGIEFMDKLSLEISYDYLGEKKRFVEAEAILIIEVDGNDYEQVRKECLEIGDLCLDGGALDAYVAEGLKDQERIWRVRKAASKASLAISSVQSVEDIVVPINKIGKIIPKIHELGKRYNVLIPCLGHAGDGNIHAIICKKPEDSMERWNEIISDCLKELYVLTNELGGTISGEHGIGHKRKKYLPFVLSQAEIEAMKNIKQALDPNLILNPGKIFD